MVDNGCRLEIDVYNERGSELVLSVKRESNRTKRELNRTRREPNGRFMDARGLRTIHVSNRSIYITDCIGPSKTVSFDRCRNTAIPT